MVVTTVHPAWKHANNTLTHLINALRAHPSFVDVPDPDRLEHKDNAWYAWDFAKKTQAMLQQIPPDLPSSYEEQWQEIVQRCTSIDAMINDTEGTLNAITGQYPGSFSFKQEEKTAAKNLALGLLELEDEYARYFFARSCRGLLNVW